MSDNADQFFSEDGAAQGDVCPSTPSKPRREKGAIKPPTFGMAVAIAIVALLLGLGIGYFAGMYVASNSQAAADGLTNGAAAAAAAKSE